MSLVACDKNPFNQGASNQTPANQGQPSQSVPAQSPPIQKPVSQTATKPVSSNSDITIVYAADSSSDPALESTLMNYWNSFLTKCGDSYFVKGGDGKIHELRSVSIGISQSGVSEADKLNRIENRYKCGLSAKACKNIDDPRLWQEKCLGDSLSVEKNEGKYIVRNSEGRVTKQGGLNVSETLRRVAHCPGKPKAFVDQLPNKIMDEFDDIIKSGWHIETIGREDFCLRSRSQENEKKTEGPAVFQVQAQDDSGNSITAGFSCPRITKRSKGCIRVFVTADLSNVALAVCQNRQIADYYVWPGEQYLPPFSISFTRYGEGLGGNNKDDFWTIEGIPLTRDEAISQMKAIMIMQQTWFDL